MAKFDSISYYLCITKFRYIYFLYIFLFGYSFTKDKELDPMGVIAITCVTVLVCIWITELVFKNYLRDTTCITLGTTSLKTMHASGKEHAIPYTQLMGPFTQNLLIVKKYTFRDLQNPFNKIIITSMTENVDKLLEELQYRMANANSK